MRASIYTNAQVRAMMLAPKYVRYDAWEERWKGRDDKSDVKHRISVCPRDEKDPTEFSVESSICIARREVAFTFFGQLIGYPMLPLCRYDFQRGKHKNPRWWPGPEWIEPRVLHRHIYDERAEREGLGWDGCAEIIGEAVDRVQQAIDRLTPAFLSDLNIEVHDPDAKGMLFPRQV
jgi:hypothetical protein